MDNRHWHACSLCGERDETVSRIVAKRMMLAQKYYRNCRQDKLTQVMLWREIEFDNLIKYIQRDKTTI